MLRDLGILKRLTREPAEAERVFREALAIGRASGPESEQQTARTSAELGYLLALEGRKAEGERLMLEADEYLAKQSDYESAQERRQVQRRLADVRRR
jgi:hypothetical protein